MESYYIGYVEGTDGGEHFKHETLKTAQKEAERLTRLTGKKVHIYKWEGSCQVTEYVPPVIWESPTPNTGYVDEKGFWYPFSSIEP